MSFPEQDEGAGAQPVPSTTEKPPRGKLSRGVLIAVIAAYVLLALMVLVVGILIVFHG